MNIIPSGKKCLPWNGLPFAIFIPQLKPFFWVPGLIFLIIKEVQWQEWRKWGRVVGIGVQFDVFHAFWVLFGHQHRRIHVIIRQQFIQILLGIVPLPSEEKKCSENLGYIRSTQESIKEWWSLWQPFNLNLAWTFAWGSEEWFLHLGLVCLDGEIRHSCDFGGGAMIQCLIWQVLGCVKWGDWKRGKYLIESLNKC